MQSPDSPLNWRTDPLLLDPEPVPPEQWLTANDLVATQQQQRFLRAAGKQLRLYPILVRREDFVRGERLLQAMPYLLLDERWARTLRNHSLALAERCHYYFNDSTAACSIKRWQQKVIKYTEQQLRIPLPMFRLAPDWEAFFAGKQQLSFQSARGEPFTLPLFLSEELAYLLGVVMGDGHLAEYTLSIIDFSEEYISWLAEELRQVFGAHCHIYRQPNAEAWTVCQKGKWVVRLLHFLTGQPIADKKTDHLREPLLLLLRPQARLRRTFWRGLMDTDGSFKNSITFGSASQELITDFRRFLHQHDLATREYHQTTPLGTTIQLLIRAAGKESYAELIGSSHPQKHQELQGLLARKAIASSTSRSKARRQETTKWPNQVIAFNEDKIVDGFFDFTHLLTTGQEICVKHAGNCIKKLRAARKQTQAQFARKLRIPRSTLSRYERNINALPLSLLQPILNLTTKQPLMPFLEEQSLSSFLRRRTTVRLDLQPTHQLLQLLRGLQLRNGYFLIVGLPAIPQEAYPKKLSNYFNISMETTPGRIYNSLLEQFVRAFCVLSPKKKGKRGHS